MTKQDQVFEKFLDKLSVDLGIDQLPKDQKEKALAKISSIAQHRILQTIMLSVKEENLVELEKELKENPNSEEVYQKLTKQIPDLDKRINDSLSELYLNLKESINQAKQEKLAK